jgi:hypothetical protein
VQLGHDVETIISSADVILLGSSYKHQLLIINLALLVGSKHFATLKN